MENALFDLVVIDEASQCDIASALPLLYRAKRAVILGDPNQLKHISTIDKPRAQELEAQFGLTAAADQPLPAGAPTTDAETLRWLAEIEQAERALADFYRALAEKAAVPEVARLFEELAGSEDEHLRHLAELRETLAGNGK